MAHIGWRAILPFEETSSFEVVEVKPQEPPYNTLTQIALAAVAVAGVMFVFIDPVRRTKAHRT